MVHNLRNLSDVCLKDSNTRNVNINFNTTTQFNDENQRWRARRMRLISDRLRNEINLVELEEERLKLSHPDVNFESQNLHQESQNSRQDFENPITIPDINLMPLILDADIEFESEKDNNNMQYRTDYEYILEYQSNNTIKFIRNYPMTLRQVLSMPIEINRDTKLIVKPPELPGLIKNLCYLKF